MAVYCPVCMSLYCTRAATPPKDRALAPTPVSRLNLQIRLSVTKFPEGVRVTRSPPARLIIKQSGLTTVYKKKGKRGMVRILVLFYFPNFIVYNALVMINQNLSVSRRVNYNKVTFNPRIFSFKRKQKYRLNWRHRLRRVDYSGWSWRHVNLPKRKYCKTLWMQIGSKAFIYIH